MMSLLLCKTWGLAWSSLSSTSPCGSASGRSGGRLRAPCEGPPHYMLVLYRSLFSLIDINILLGKARQIRTYEFIVRGSTLPSLFSLLGTASPALALGGAPLSRGCGACGGIGSQWTNSKCSEGLDLSREYLRRKRRYQASPATHDATSSTQRKRESWSRRRIDLTSIIYMFICI